MKRTQAAWLEVDQYLEAFETAQRQTPGIDIDEFLPSNEHPLYNVILKELIRIDLEYRNHSGMPRTLDYYHRVFPMFFLDREAVREVAFEEFRQRRERGENPSLAEYEQRFGVDTSRWPKPTSLVRFPTRLPRV